MFQFKPLIELIDCRLSCRRWMPAVLINSELESCKPSLELLGGAYRLLVPANLNYLMFEQVVKKLRSGQVMWAENLQPRNAEIRFADTQRSSTLLFLSTTLNRAVQLPNNLGLPA